jgi:thymidylate kinase
VCASSLRQRPLLVELAGVAGAGKSALSRALHRRDPAVRAGFEIWQLPHLWLLADGLLCLPTLLRCWRACRGSCREEANHIVRLHTLSWWLSRESSKGYKTLPLVEGAVYVLAWLYAFGHHGARSRCMEGWWRAALQRWAATLDVIIWLDAPDAVLAQRIRTRNGLHPYAGWADQPLYEFFARWRAGYQYVVSQLAEARGPKVMTFATDQEPPDRIADRILTSLNATPSTK